MVDAIILAAGSGTRLGTPKALARVGDRTLVEIVVETCARSMVDEVVVVTGARAEEVERLSAAAGRRHPDVPVRCVRNARWSRGRTGSLQIGWREVPVTAHVLVFPVDHPSVSLVTLDSLLGVFGYAAAQPRVVVPVVSCGPDGGPEGARRRGHPILLGASVREEVLAMGEDEPLRDLVHREVVLEVPVDDLGILLNVDVPADLERAAELLSADGAGQD